MKLPCKHCECITEVNKNSECAYCAHLKELEDEMERCDIGLKVVILIIIILWLVIYGGVEYLHDAVVKLVG